MKNSCKTRKAQQKLWQWWDERWTHFVGGAAFFPPSSRVVLLFSSFSGGAAFTPLPIGWWCLPLLPLMWCIFSLLLFGGAALPFWRWCSPSSCWVVVVFSSTVGWCCLFLSTLFQWWCSSFSSLMYLHRNMYFLHVHLSIFTKIKQIHEEMYLKFFVESFVSVSSKEKQHHPQGVQRVGCLSTKLNDAQCGAASKRIVEASRMRTIALHAPHAEGSTGGRF